MLDTRTWEPFLLSDIFEIKKGKRLTKENQTLGDTVFIGATACNNGITSYIGQEAIHEGNTISLTYNGSVGEAFYQPEPFWASDDVNVLYPKNFVLNESIAVFFCAILRHEKQMWSYARKWNLTQMNNTQILLPVNSNGNPDYDLMEKYIKSLDGDVKNIPDYFLNEGYDKACWYLDNLSQSEFEDIYAGIACPREINLKNKKWGFFKINEMFKTYTGGDLIIGDIQEGDIPVISHSAENNGVKIYSSEIEGQKLFDHTKTISLADRGTFFAAVQYKDFYIGTRVKALEFLDGKHSAEVMLFFATIINYEKFRFCYGRNCTNGIDDLEISLPIDENNKPDYKFMEEYIRSLPFSKMI